MNRSCLDTFTFRVNSLEQTFSAALYHSSKMMSDQSDVALRPVRMRDVAKLAGVGTMTVSRVLSGNTKVSTENRDRVLEAIQSLNYIPNPVARSLRQQRSRQIGCIVPDIRDPFFAVCFDAIGTVAAQHDYSVVLATSGEDAEQEFKEASRLLRRVDGLIITPAARGRSRLAERTFNNFPLVAVDRPLEGKDVDSVLVENERGAYLGTKHLIGHGHQRIAHLSLSHGLYTMQSRVEGYSQAMQESGLKPDVHVVGIKQPDMLAAVQQLTARANPPTAFFCGNNVLSCNAVHALSGLGLRIPDDVALVGFDDFDTADILRPALTVARQPIEDIGRIAAEMLFKRLLHLASPTMEMSRKVLPTELIVRNSCGCNERSRNEEYSNQDYSLASR